MKSLTENFAKVFNSHNGLKEDIGLFNDGLYATVVEQEMEPKYLSYDELGIETPEQLPEPGETDNANYVSVALAAVCADHDFHHIHLHANGKNFDKIHSIAQEYYEKIADDEDLFAEMALESGQMMPNFNLAYTTLDWDVQVEDSYDYEAGIIAIKNVMFSYLAYLDSQTLESIGDKKAKMEEVQRYWHKELYYKLERRL